MNKAGFALTPEIQAEVTGYDQFRDELGRFAEQTDDRVSAITRHYGAVLQSQVRARARTLFDVTDYDDSVWLEFRPADNRHAALIGTNEVQARRLEYGFVGRDALGRYVEQPPRPHFRPAFDGVVGDYARAIKALLFQ